MTTSNSVDFSVTRDNLITDAMTLTGIVGIGETPSATQITWGARILNQIVKAWHSKGIQLWARKTGYVLPVTGVNSTTLGPSGGHATLSYTQTTLSAAATDGATTVVVTSATGISNGYYIGIEQTDGTMHWTTVNGAPSGTTVTLTAAITENCDSGAWVYVYQTKLQRPVRVVEAYVHNQSSGADRQIEVVAKSIYDLYGYKPGESSPILCAYDPQLDNGIFYYAPRFEDGEELITIIFQRPFEDFDATGDTPDFPQEGYDALMMALAVRVAPAGGLPVQDRALLKAEAKEAFDLFTQNEPEEGSYQMQPEIQ